MAKTATKSTDELAKELYDKVKADKLQVAQAEKPCWATNGLFRFSTESAHASINIQTSADVRKLVEILAFLIGRERDHKEANTRTGLSLSFTWLGFTTAEWESDIVTRVNQIQLADKKRKLAIAENKLEGLISPDLKRQLDLESIQMALQES